MDRIEIVVKLLSVMIMNGGDKKDKVKAACEYADLILEENKEYLRQVVEQNRRAW